MTDGDQFRFYVACRGESTAIVVIPESRAGVNPKHCHVWPQNPKPKPTNKEKVLVLEDCNLSSGGKKDKNSNQTPKVIVMPCFGLEKWSASSEPHAALYIF